MRDVGGHKTRPCKASTLGAGGHKTRPCKASTLVVGGHKTRPCTYVSVEIVVKGGHVNMA